MSFTCLDTSSDKNIKILGMDFGDCHRIFLAHNDIINYVKFCIETHYFLTFSKDRTIKFYDRDAFEMVMKYNKCFL